MGAGEPLAEHELRERDAFALEQTLDIARRQLCLRRHRRARNDDAQLMDLRMDPRGGFRTQKQNGIAGAQPKGKAPQAAAPKSNPPPKQ
jgi:hypothetical protein